VDLAEAVREFSRRERRFGTVPVNRSEPEPALAAVAGSA